MNIEIYHDGSQYSANHTITFNLDTGSQLHRIELLYRTMTLCETGHSLEEVLENVKKTLEFIRIRE